VLHTLGTRIACAAADEGIIDDEYLSEAQDHSPMVARLCHPLMQQQSQVGLLLLRVCALPRMDYVARTAPPRLTLRAAHHFDEHALGCFGSMLGIHVDAAPDHVRTQISLPLSVGGMGLRPLQRTSHAAYPAAGMLALTDLIRTASPSTAARWPTHPLCIDMQSCVDALVAHNVDVKKVCAHGLLDEPIATLWTRMSALLAGPLSADVQSYVQSSTPSPRPSKPTSSRASNKHFP